MNKLYVIGGLELDFFHPWVECYTLIDESEHSYFVRVNGQRDSFRKKSKYHQYARTEEQARSILNMHKSSVIARLSDRLHVIKNRLEVVIKEMPEEDTRPAGGIKLD